MGQHHDGELGGGATTLALDGSDALYTQRLNLYVGSHVSHPGGTLTVTLGSDNAFMYGGTYDLSGGTLSVGPTSSCHLNISGGTFNQTNGTFYTGYDLTLTGTTLTPVYTINGGTASFREFNVGRGLYGSAGAGIVNIQTGATVTVRGNYTNVGNSNAVSGDGTINQTGGSFSMGGVGMNIYSHGTVNFSGGTFTGGHVNISGGTFNQTAGTITPTFDINVYDGAFNLSGSAICDPRAVMVQGSAGKTGTFDVVSGTLLANPGNAPFVVGGTAGTSVFNQHAGAVDASAAVGFQILGNGTYNFESGTLASAEGWITNGTMNQTGGAWTHAFELNVAQAPGSTGLYNMTSGTSSFRGLAVGAKTQYGNIIAVGGAGTVIVGPTATLTVNNTTCQFTISHPAATADSSVVLQGGTVTDAGPANTAVNPRGTIRGYGNWNLRNVVTMNGKVVADGGGTDRVLAMTSYSGLANSVDNTSDKGWYATNHGRLDLKPFAVSGTATYYWGEQGNLDLVNAVRLAFTGASGTLTGRLYASDYSTVPSLGTYYRPLGVWEFSGPTFTSADLTFRLDDAQLATYYGYAGPAAPLQLLRYTGGAWQLVPDSLDWSTKTFTATGITGFSTFSLVALPEPGALTLAAMGLALALRRRRCG